MIPHTPECLNNHLGTWAIEPAWFRGSMSWLRTTGFAAAIAHPRADGAQAAAAGERRFAASGGIAMIPIYGSMMKGQSKFGGTSTQDTRRAITAAASDKSIDGIMLHIDSPGGHVAGTQELADDIAAADKIKPVHAHIDDLGASAAYWAGSQARNLTINEAGSAGSIGVFAVMYDTSGAAEAEGVKVHVVSTGEHKGAGIDGAPITDDQLSEFQGQVDGINELFLAAVKRGRKLPANQVRDLADGRVLMSRQAQAAGLVDAVMPFEASVRRLQAVVRSEKRSNTAAAKIALAKITRA